MQIFLKLEVEDIITRPFGGNIAITPPGGPAIIFSPEAAIEFTDDTGKLILVDPDGTCHLREDWREALAEFLGTKEEENPGE